jgi:hypothetical protein
MGDKMFNVGKVRIWKVLLYKLMVKVAQKLGILNWHKLIGRVY